MTKIKSLLDGIGNQSVTEKYYDDWALNYDQTLKLWSYKAPSKAAVSYTHLTLPTKRIV